VFDVSINGITDEKIEMMIAKEVEPLKISTIHSVWSRIAILYNAVRG